VPITLAKLADRIPSRPKEGRDLECEVATWIKEGWQWMLNEALGFRSHKPKWFGLPVMRRIAVDASDRIFQACMKLQDPVYDNVYTSARLAVRIAQIGIYAIALHEDAVFRAALGHYSEVRRTFRERYPDLAFVGNFDAAERELLDDQPAGVRAMLDPQDAEVYSTVTREQIQEFFAALE
jgi:hypothetical protein